MNQNQQPERIGEHEKKLAEQTQTPPEPAVEEFPEEPDDDEPKKAAKKASAKK